jgi:hypothetical protein
MVRFGGGDSIVKDVRRASLMRVLARLKDESDFRPRTFSSLAGPLCKGGQRMIPKSGNRFSDKIMRKEKWR